MKRTLLILGSIVLLMLLLLFRLIYKQNNGLKNEREWFVKNLKYEFSARVDTLVQFNESAGRLRCIVTQGVAQSYKEDSLKKHFKEFDMLYFIYIQSYDTITFILPNHIERIEKGDSLRVSSKEDLIQFYRADSLISSNILTGSLTGWNRPFFVKGDSK